MRSMSKEEFSKLCQVLEFDSGFDPDYISDDALEHGISRWDDFLGQYIEVKGE